MACSVDEFGLDAYGIVSSVYGASSDGDVGGTVNVDAVVVGHFSVALYGEIWTYLDVVTVYNV